MDQALPEGAQSEIDIGLLRRQRSATRRVVIAGQERHPIVKLCPRGFVIEAETPPRLRGFVDLVEGEKRLGTCLVVFAWARDGLAGYEYKRQSMHRPAAPDYAPDS